MGKTRDLKKIRDTKGTFHAKESESEVAQSCPTVCDPVDCSPPGFSVHGILQARIRSGLPFPSPGESSRPRDQTQVSHISGRCFNLWTTREAQENQRYQGNISCKDGLNKGQKWYGPTQKQKILRRGGKNIQKNYTKKIFKTQITWWCDHSPRARHPGMQSQVGLRKHHY